MRQLFTSVTQERSRTGCGWACTLTSHPCTPPQGTVHHYNHCPPLSMRGHRGYHAAESLLWSLNSKCFRQTWKRGNGWKPAWSPQGQSIGRTKKPHHHQCTSRITIWMLSGNCTVVGTVLAWFLMQSINSVWKREGRDKPSWLSHISLRILSEQRVQSTFTLDALLITEKITGCVGFSASFDKAKGFRFLFAVIQHRLAC